MSANETLIDLTLTRIERNLDRVDAQIEAWTAKSLDAAPPVAPETRARVARLLAEGGETS